MDLMVQLRYLFLANCLLEITGCPADDHCHRQTFYEVPNQWHIGSALLTDGPWPLHKCQRLCRQYLECSSFGVEWLNDRFGMCTIYNGVLNITNLVEKNQVTLYMPCPKFFQWQRTINKCYLSWFRDVKGTEIVEVCKKMDQKATPVEPRNEAQMDIINQLAGTRTAWLGIHRADTVGFVDDYRYYSDGTKITYSNLEEYGEDSLAGYSMGNNGNAGRCVAMFGREQQKWQVVGCDKVYDLLCEL